MERLTVKGNGFYGIYHKAKNPIDEKKIVIVVGGSEGNENIPLNVGHVFSENGISALGICYWNVEGLPNQLIRVPIEPFEKAVQWLKEKGYEKIFIYGISKGAELALLTASLIKDISGVVALSPSHCVWGGMEGNKGMASKSFSKISEFTWRGKEFPCMVAELTYGPAIKNLIFQRQFNLKYMYENPLKNFNEETAIHVEDINGDILFIYASDDLMWPSKDSVKYMVNRLKNKNWNHKVKTLEYQKASHIMVPLNPSSLKMFKVERKYKDECRENRQDAFKKTLLWINER